MLLGYRSSIILALEMAISATLSLWLGTWFSQALNIDTASIGGLWSAISAILITQATNQETFKAAWLRVIGSLIGAIAAGIVVSLFGYAWWAFALGMLLTVVVCSLVNLADTFRLACLTLSVVMVIGQLTPAMNPWINSAGRFVESLIGVIVALLIAIPLKPLRHKLRLAYQTSVMVKRPK